MPSHMLQKPRKGTARKLQQARRRLAQTKLAAASVLVRERDGNCCRVCGSRVRVQVHHIVYRSRGGSHDTSNLVCLCGSCHDSVHAGRIHLGGNADDIGWSVFTEKLYFDATTGTYSRLK